MLEPNYSVRMLSWARCFFFFLLSFFLVAYAQPDLSPFCCIITSICGYALFWKALVSINSLKNRFFLSYGWFSAITAVHLSWFSADRYVGSAIYLFIALLMLLFGLCFALFSLCIKKDMKILTAFALAALWTLGEWGRLFVLSGFSFNPVGFALSATSYGMQMAALGGIYGMSFWVMSTNLLVFKFFTTSHRKRLSLFLCALCLAPYLFGIGHLKFHEKKMLDEKKAPLSVVCVQTALYPEEKMPGIQEGKEPFSPLEQWQRILLLLQQHKDKKIDLIVLPEAVVPYGAFVPIYEHSYLSLAFQEILNTTPFLGKNQLPDKNQPTDRKRCGNSDFAQAIANTFHADVLVGLEDGGRKVYNAAFLFRPFSTPPQRYEKRVLVPMGESIPFEWCKKFLARYGIADSFAAGQEAKVFETQNSAVGISICYEETYGHLMRENRLKGATLLANLTNDAWYPHSRLPVVHYLHGRMRSIETGIPMVRACNTGVTCGINSLGQTVAQLDYEKKGVAPKEDALYFQLSSYTYSTLYSKWGDFIIVNISVFVLILFCFSALLRILAKKQQLI